MIVGKLHIVGVAVFKAEDNPPVGAHGNAPVSLPVAFERMQAVSGKIQILGTHGVVQNGQNLADGLDQIRPDQAPVVFPVEPF